MSIIIKGLDMPKEPICIAIYPVDNTCGNVVRIDTLDENRKATGTICGHAFQLPPHGRLIDADAVYDAVERRYRVSSGAEHRAERDFLDLISDAPTIIEEE